MSSSGMPRRPLASIQRFTGSLRQRASMAAKATPPSTHSLPVASEPTPRAATTRLKPSSRRMGQRFTAPQRSGRRHLLPKWLAKGGLGAWALIGMAIVVAAIVFGLSRITAVFIAVFVALVLTAILNPVVNLLDRWINRWIAVIISVLGFFAIFGALMTAVVTSVAGQWPKLVSQFSNGVDMIIEFLQATPFHIQLTPEEISGWWGRTWDSAMTYLQDNWSSLATNVLSNVGTVGLFFTILALSMFVTIFFLHSGSSMWRWFINLLPERNRPRTVKAADAGWYTFSGYARGTMIVAGTNGIIATVFLLIVGVPLAPALGVLVFIGAFIPLIGAPAAMVIAMIVALATNGIWQAALVGIGIALIGQIEGHVLEPLIMGKQVSLHPVVVGIGVTMGTFLAGLLGAIIAIPIIAVVWAVFSALYEKDPPVEGPLQDLYREPSAEIA